MRIVISDRQHLPVVNSVAVAIENDPIRALAEVEAHEAAGHEVASAHERDRLVRLAERVRSGRPLYSIPADPIAEIERLLKVE